jgi:hypothetical protein
MAAAAMKRMFFFSARAAISCLRDLIERWYEFNLRERLLDFILRELDFGIVLKVTEII